jgi:hypothetical protein
LDSALRLFADTFVVDDKRKQIHDRLFTADRRIETLETLPRWIKTRTAPLEGKDKSPAGLQARFGEVIGIFVDDSGATRVTIVEALERGRGRATLFIADNGNLALISTAEAALLCSKL